MLRAAAIALVVCGPIYSQAREAGIPAGERAILDEARPRRDFPCKVQITKPTLGFDLRMHVRVQALVRPPPPVQFLRVVTRVVPAGAAAQASHFTDRILVPASEQLRGKQLAAASGFALGEGRYRVDWLLQDQAGRVCSEHWSVEAKLPSRARGVSLLPPGRVQSNSVSPFRREPPAEKPSRGLRVKILVNFASRSVSTAVLEPRNLDPVLSALRALVRDTRIARLSVVGFLLADQRVFHRQPEAGGIDFPGLGRALRSLELGTVDAERLAQEKGQERFLADLLKAEISSADGPDALVIVSPRVWTKGDIPSRSLKQLGPLGYPVFYLKSGPFRLPDSYDAIGRLIGIFKGKEYWLVRPEDIGYSARDVVDRVARSKPASGGQPNRTAVVE